MARARLPIRPFSCRPDHLLGGSRRVAAGTVVGRDGHGRTTPGHPHRAGEQAAPAAAAGEALRRQWPAAAAVRARYRTRARDRRMGAATVRYRPQRGALPGHQSTAPGHPGRDRGALHRRDQNLRGGSGRCRPHLPGPAAVATARHRVRAGAVRGGEPAHAAPRLPMGLPGGDPHRAARPARGRVPGGAGCRARRLGGRSWPCRLRLSHCGRTMGYPRRHEGGCGMSELERLRSPADLRALSPRRRRALAEEIREFLVDSVARTAGHLGPNLGVVELTLAIHSVFSSPRDSIVFDTGHQAYVHKILTGRHDFSALRKKGGLSGYPSRAESEHDVVENSHASTAISWADGISRARLLAAEHDRHTVAVIGDGALTGGMAWEALNNLASAPDQRVVIVVNDNGWSYSPTVGGLARYLDAVRTGKHYE